MIQKYFQDILPSTLMGEPSFIKIANINIEIYLFMNNPIRIRIIVHVQWVKLILENCG